MLGQAYREGLTGWGRAHKEPDWVVYTNRTGIIAIVVCLMWPSDLLIFFGVTCCVIAGLGYLVLTLLAVFRRT